MNGRRARRSRENPQNPLAQQHHTHHADTVRDTQHSSIRTAVVQGQPKAHIIGGVGCDSYSPLPAVGSTNKRVATQVNLRSFCIILNLPIFGASHTDASPRQRQRDVHTAVGQGRPKAHIMAGVGS
ncbi:unnamed protein product [Ectocarpus sp. 8 AP-2014]